MLTLCAPATLQALTTARGMLYDELPVYVARMSDANLRDKLTNIGAFRAYEGALPLTLSAVRFGKRAPRRPPPSHTTTPIPPFRLLGAGPSAAINDLVTGVADRAVEYINSHQSAFHVPVDPLQPTVDKYTPYVDKAVGAPGTFPDTTAHGAAYYFGMLAVPDK
jgi:hypothetical protein